MKFSHNYTKLKYPIFTTIRQNKKKYKEGQVIKIETLNEKFEAEIVSIREIYLNHITDIIALRDADCDRDSLIENLSLWYKDKANNLILITLMRVK